ncbi:MAG: glycosyltransferase family 4 protein [Candidatus Magasanikbacteria bacterium]|nr:glycosyltransferase family 4 protein [Candidatus Magasanikbacteria bacterium]
MTSYGFNSRMRNFEEFIVARILAKKNWQVYALAKNEVDKTEHVYEENIDIFKTVAILPGIFHIIKILLFVRPNVVHIFNARNNHLGIIAALLCKLAFKPFLFSEYGLLHDHYLVTDRDNPFPLSEKLIKDGPIFSFWKTFRDPHLSANLKNYFFHFPLSHAKKIVFVSKHNIEIAEKIGLKNSAYLPYIFDDERWGAMSTIDHEKTGKLGELLANTSSNPILFIGQLKLRKGWDIILEALPYINNGLKVKLIFITSSADDQEPPELTVKIDTLGIRDKVIFLGRATGKDLKTAYESSKLVVVPSRYEGFGLAVTEAWAIKKPVVASDVIAINEHCVNEENCLLVKPEDPKSLAQAIEKILLNDQLALRLVSGGSKSFQELQSEPMINQWLEFYSAAIREKTSSL